jgi:hypothetical protein
VNAIRMARLMSDKHGAYTGARKLQARANYYSQLADARTQDHRRLTRNEYAFRALWWRTCSRVCIARHGGGRADA